MLDESGFLQLLLLELDGFNCIILRLFLGFYIILLFGTIFLLVWFVFLEIDMLLILLVRFTFSFFFYANQSTRILLSIVEALVFSLIFLKRWIFLEVLEPNIFIRISLRFLKFNFISSKKTSFLLFVFSSIIDQQFK